MSGDNNGTSAKRQRGNFFEFHSSSVNFWSKNPLANLFRKSGRKQPKRSKEEEQPNTLAQQSKRSSSCDALNQPRLSTRFDAEPIGGTLLRNGISKKKKSLDQSAFNRGSGQSSSFSSLLHHRILLSSRGASPLVPHKIHKTAKLESTKFGSNQHRGSSKSQQNIPRIIDSEVPENSAGTSGAGSLSSHSRRREHSLGADPSRVRHVPIVQLPSTSAPQRPPALNPVAHTFFYERRQQFVQSSQQLGSTSVEECRKSSLQEGSLALEEWMLTQPITMRRLEQHERIRLKMAGKQNQISHFLTGGFE